MKTIIKTDVIQSGEEGNLATIEIRGLSTDEKPTEVNGNKIGNGSIYIEMNTGKIYFYDLENEQWLEF